MAYVNKGRIEGFELSLVNLKPTKKIKINRYFKPIPIYNVFRTIEEAENRADELNNDNYYKEVRSNQLKKLGNKDNPAYCRGEIIEAVKAIIIGKNKNEFTAEEVINYMQQNNTKYKESTISTHITSKCCINTNDNHGTTYEDFERIKRGIYKLL